MVTPAARREAVAHLRVAFEVSERRACSTLCTDRTSVRYRSRRPSDAAARGRLRELALVRRRFGYRRLHILLTREGIVMNHKKLRRLYREERLAVRRRGGRKRALGTRAPMALLQGPHQRWSLDFLSDAFADGRRFRILAIVDDFTRECLALVPDTSLSHVREALAIWREDYNTVRPHSALGNLPPATYAKLSAPVKQRDGALRYVEGSAPRPVASPSHQGSNEARTLPIGG